MENQTSPQPPPATPGAGLTMKFFGVGHAGLQVLDKLITAGVPAAACVAVDSDAQALANSSATEKILLESPPTLLRASDNSMDLAAVVEKRADQLKALYNGAGVVFIIAGLGGCVGTSVSPVLVRLAKETGALVLAFVLRPFECEGTRRQQLAAQGLEQLQETADGVICLPNQRVLKIVDENTSVLDTFKTGNELLAEGIRGIWLLLAHKGLIEIHLAELCALLRGRHTESAFAVAEAMGATRSREITDRLLAHPMLEQGKALADSGAVLVSILGGPDLTMVEVSRIMQEINGHCEHAQVIMGAAIDEGFRERLNVTLIATSVQRARGPEPSRSAPESLDAQLLNRGAEEPRVASRFVPPAPSLSPEAVEQMLAQQKAAAGSRGRRSHTRLRQGQLPLEIVSKGRFDKSEPTIHKGEDLDVPTYIRRGVVLN